MADPFRALRKFIPSPPDSTCHGNIENTTRPDEVSMITIGTFHFPWRGAMLFGNCQAMA